LLRKDSSGSDMPERVELRVTLEGNLAKNFLDIKRAMGLSTNSEVVRALVNRAYEALKKGVKA
jgi:hypothetical protein